MFILIWTKGKLLLVRSWTGKSNKKYLKTVIVLWSCFFIQTYKLLLWPTPSVFCLYLYLSFSHNLVCDLSVLFALLHFAAALLVAEQPQRLRALQFNLKLLVQEQNKCSLGFSRVHICVNFWISLSIEWSFFFLTTQIISCKICGRVFCFSKGTSFSAYGFVFSPRSSWAPCCLCTRVF